MPSLPKTWRVRNTKSYFKSVVLNLNSIGNNRHHLCKWKKDVHLCRKRELSLFSSIIVSAKITRDLKVNIAIINWLTARLCMSYFSHWAAFVWHMRLSINILCNIYCLKSFFCSTNLLFIWKQVLKHVIIFVIVNASYGTVLGTVDRWGLAYWFGQKLIK